MKWKQAFKAGHFMCPVPTCTKHFFVPNHFVAHLQNEAKVDEIIQQIKSVECPFCSSVMDWVHFGRHMQNNHREVCLQF